MIPSRNPASAPLRPLRGWMCGGALLLFAAAAFGEAERGHQPGQVKAAFLFNFAKYVQWSDRGEGMALRLCIVGETPLDGVLTLLRGQRVRQKSIEVERLAAEAPLDRCRVLFVGDGTEEWRAAILAKATGGEALTVSDRPGFVDAGGMIELFMEGERVRFAVNLDAVRGSPLTVSSRLLRLARRLVESGEERR